MRKGGIICSLTISNGSALIKHIRKKSILEEYADLQIKLRTIAHFIQQPLCWRSIRQEGQRDSQNDVRTRMFHSRLI